jgi:hypothetical protein
MSYPINYPTPQGANVQIFYAGGNGAGSTLRITPKDWVKPQGASFVWFTLIGAGGGAYSTGGFGGGSGAVTNFMGPAFLMPNVLRVNVGRGGPVGTDGSASTVVYQQKDGTGYTLLTASAGQGNLGNAGGTAMTANFFTAMGFFQSVAGDDGRSGGGGVPSTTFLTGGCATGGSQSNYGYTSSSKDGFFQMQPIIVGVGGGNVGTGGKGGIGCGGGYSTGDGGDGLVVIITW